MYVINAVGLSGGGVNIFLDFSKVANNLDVVLLTDRNTKHIADKYFPGKKNIVVKFAASYFGRFIFHLFYIYYFISFVDKRLELIVSFNNLAFGAPKYVRQIIYFHQPISLSCYRWSFFRRDERLLWFYKSIYVKIIRLFLKHDTKVVVQTNWMKKAFIERFKHNHSLIHVIRPMLNIDFPSNSKFPPTNNERCLFFYPAGDIVYKNHMILIKALNYLKKDNAHSLKKILIIFTLTEQSSTFKIVREYGLEDNFKFIGNKSYEDVICLYSEADVVIFPSKIESLGLPLLEGMMFRKKILVADESYSQEVLGGYTGAVFISTNSPEDWAGELEKCINRDPEKFISCDVSEQTWSSFLNIFK